MMCWAMWYAAVLPCRCAAVRGYSQYSDLELGGLLVNQRNIEKEDARVAEFAEEMKVSVFGQIPRCGLVQTAEEQGKTVVALFPESEQAAVYSGIAQKILERWGQKERG